MSNDDNKPDESDSVVTDMAALLTQLSAIPIGGSHLNVNDITQRLQALEATDVDLGKADVRGAQTDMALIKAIKLNTLKSEKLHDILSGQVVPILVAIIKRL